MNPQARVARDDQVLWQYMTFTEFLALLHNQALFFCRVDRLPDRWEGVFPEKVLEYWGQNSSSVEINQALIRQYYVNCWYQGDCESEAMWRLYSRNDEGIAIKSTLGRLGAAFTGSVLQPVIGKVEYIDYETWEPPVPGDEKDIDLARIFFWKRKSFEYEQELRLLVKAEAGSQPGLSIQLELAKLITGVRIFPFAKEWFVSLVESIIKRFGYQTLEVSKSPLGKRPW